MLETYFADAALIGAMNCWHLAVQSKGSLLRQWGFQGLRYWTACAVLLVARNNKELSGRITVQSAHKKSLRKSQARCDVLIQASAASNRSAGVGLVPH